LNSEGIQDKDSNIQYSIFNIQIFQFHFFFLLLLFFMPKILISLWRQSSSIILRDLNNIKPNLNLLKPISTNLLLMVNNMGKFDIGFQKRSISTWIRTHGGLNVNSNSDLKDLWRKVDNMGKIDIGFQKRSISGSKLNYWRTFFTSVRLDAENSSLQSQLELRMLLQTQGRYQEAETLLKKLFDESSSTLGDYHPDTLKAMNQLAILLCHQEKYREAESLVKENLEQSRRMSGESHSDTLKAMISLASVYRNQKKDHKAEPIYHAILTTCRRYLGGDEEKIERASKLLKEKQFEKMEGLLLEIVAEAE